MPQPQITGDSSQEPKERYYDVVHVDVRDDDEGGGGAGSEDDVVDDDDDYDAVCVCHEKWSLPISKLNARGAK